MTAIEIHAFILLLFRIGSVIFLGMVLRQQLKLLRDTVTDFPYIRRILISLLVLSLIANAIPIGIDMLTLLGKSYAGRLLIPYAYSNALGMLGLSFGLWVMYREIEKERQANKKERNHLVADNKQLTKDNKALRG